MNIIVYRVVFLELIQSAFRNNRVLYSRHAKFEMMNEELGQITDSDIEETIEKGEIIEEYLTDKPYPSVLIYGLTNKNRPIHIVAAFDSDNDSTIIITVYEPESSLWIDYKVRRKK
ncbi:DUF4258 domain-containing protein [Leptospira sp. GIMC2001]|uniref:DUF4258 domain-containing protein n=1 Tax=Leptospira sp. GIMC2001 TaxID=1513297 RepID=UPI00234BEDFC|nr:DUF4258 domain-containing protein [Leptospira sp. GIMC2001]WCL50640.1 DUF4258 domain-containing protein [Leptospira sp. GIMC2001]